MAKHFGKPYVVKQITLKEALIGTGSRRFQRIWRWRPYAGHLRIRTDRRVCGLSRQV